jgi:hypothetical protein
MMPQEPSQKNDIVTAWSGGEGDIRDAMNADVRVAETYASVPIEGAWQMKNTSMIYLAAVVIAITTIGAAFAAKASSTAASVGTLSGGPSDSSGGTKVASITDPILNMKAYSITIPANWVFEGAVIRGTSCIDGPFPVFRMSTPDGLVGIKQLPRMDWTWSDNPKLAVEGGSDCLPYKKEMSAAEMMKVMIGILQVEFVKDEPTPDLAEMRKKAAAQSMPNLTMTVDKARATVRYRINKIVMEGRLNTFVSCTTYRKIGRHSCSLGVARTWAPQGKYSDETFKSISRTFAIDQDWNAKRVQIVIQKLNDLSEQSMRTIRKMGEEVTRRSTAQYNAFQQSQDMRQRQHEQFLDTMQRGTDLSMKQAAASANANHRAADDWCDYSLDLQKRLDPNTGLITKDSSAYNYTWVNETGDRVQTNNINANPNGNGSGNWTLQENIH